MHYDVDRVPVVGETGVKDTVKVTWRSQDEIEKVVDGQCCEVTVGRRLHPMSRQNSHGNGVAKDAKRYYDRDYNLLNHEPRCFQLTLKRWPAALDQRPRGHQRTPVGYSGCVAKRHCTLSSGFHQPTTTADLTQSCPWVHFVWPDPTQQISWLTQPNPLQVEKFGPNPTQPNTTNNWAYSLVVTYFYTKNLSCTFS